MKKSTLFLAMFALCSMVILSGCISNKKEKQSAENQVINEENTILGDERTDIPDDIFEGVYLGNSEALVFQRINDEQLTTLVRIEDETKLKDLQTGDHFIATSDAMATSMPPILQVNTLSKIENIEYDSVTIDDFYLWSAYTDSMKLIQVDNENPDVLFEDAILLTSDNYKEMITNDFKHYAIFIISNDGYDELVYQELKQDGYNVFKIVNTIEEGNQ